MADSSKTALLVIDVQQGFDHPTHWGTGPSNPQFKDNLITVLKHFRDQIPKPLIIHVQHQSRSPESMLHPSSAGVNFYDYSTPASGEQTITKDVNSAFIGTKLEQILREHDVRKLYCVGLTIDQCVSTTVRMASNLRVCDRDGEKGEVVLIGDATAAFSYAGLDADVIHRVHEATLGHEFCTVIQTADLLKQDVLQVNVILPR